MHRQGNLTQVKLFAFSIFCFNPLFILKYDNFKEMHSWISGFDKICLEQGRTDYALHCSQPIQEDKSSFQNSLKVVVSFWLRNKQVN